jgi:hypothetical protein
MLLYQIAKIACDDLWRKKALNSKQFSRYFKIDLRVGR